MPKTARKPLDDLFTPKSTPSAWQMDTSRRMFGREAHLSGLASRWGLYGYVMPGRAKAAL